MINYLIKRLIFSLITLIAVSLIIFGISKMGSNDPIRSMMSEDDSAQNNAFYISNYQALANIFGLDKPVFYFSFSPVAYPDTLYKIMPAARRQNMVNMIIQSGNWPLIENYQQELYLLQNNQIVLDTYYDPLIEYKRLVKRLTSLDDFKAIENQIISLEDTIQQDNLLKEIYFDQFYKVKLAFEDLVAHPKRHLLYIPSFKWYGFDNQYHHWLTSLFRFEFGTSYIERRPVSKKLEGAILTTLQLNGFAILFAILLAIPIGVYAGAYPGQWFDRISSVLIFIFYSLPSFWVATLALVFLTNPEYGMDWFPATGLGYPPKNAGFLERLTIKAQHLILPVFCLGIGSVAFIARQIKNGMQEALSQDFIRTARAKGLSEFTVISRHALRNALFPLITIIARIVPALIAGSVVIEQIFNIPGMGFVTLSSIGQRDWPVVFAVVMIGAFFTIVGLLLSDILYSWADPRVKLNK